jgi:hypothetical protein
MVPTTWTFSKNTKQLRWRMKIFLSSGPKAESKEKHGVWMGPYAVVDYLQSRLRHIYHGQPYARVDLNPMPEPTLSPSPGLRIWRQVSYVAIIASGLWKKWQLKLWANVLLNGLGHQMDWATVDMYGLDTLDRSRTKLVSRTVFEFM